MGWLEKHIEEQRAYWQRQGLSPERRDELFDAAAEYSEVDEVIDRPNETK